VTKRRENYIASVLHFVWAILAWWWFLPDSQSGESYHKNPTAIKATNKKPQMSRRVCI